MIKKRPLSYLFSISSLLFSASCETAPRFAPLPIENSHTSKTLPAEEWIATSQPTGPLPEVNAPSLTCLQVDTNGRTTLPPLKSGQSLDGYKDALVCLVSLSATEPYEQMTAQLRVGFETSPFFEGALPTKENKTRERVLWIPGKQWRELVAEKKLFSIEVVFPCEEQEQEEEGMGCELVLSQSFAVSPLPAETHTEPKSIKGPTLKVSAIHCGGTDTFGRWSEELSAESFLTEQFFCEVGVENSTETKLENITLQLRGGTSKANSKVLSEQFFTSLEPKESVSYLFYGYVPLSQNGSFVLSGAAGRNSNERNNSLKSLTVKTQAIAASLPTTEPTEPETD